jgi:hypothetical protein
MLAIDVLGKSERIMEKYSEHYAIDRTGDELFSTLTYLSPNCFHQRIYHFDLLSEVHLV